MSAVRIPLLLVASSVLGSACVPCPDTGTDSGDTGTASPTGTDTGDTGTASPTGTDTGDTAAPIPDEVCDGADNDGDGLVDEGVAGSNLLLNGGFEDGNEDGTFAEGWSGWSRTYGDTTCGTGSVGMDTWDFSEGRRSVRVDHDCMNADGGQNSYVYVDLANRSAVDDDGSSIYVAFDVMSSLSGDLEKLHMDTWLAASVSGTPLHHGGVALDVQGSWRQVAVGPFDLQRGDLEDYPVLQLELQWGALGSLWLDDVRVYTCE